jgi:hypothetical protein
MHPDLKLASGGRVIPEGATARSPRTGWKLAIPPYLQEVSAMKPGLLRWFVVAAAVAFLLHVPSASAQELVRATRLVFTSNAHDDQEFPSEEAACRAYASKQVPGSTFTGFDDYKKGDDQVRCLWTTRDGDKDGFTGGAGFRFQKPRGCPMSVETSATLINGPPSPSNGWRSFLIRSFPKDR